MSKGQFEKVTALLDAVEGQLEGATQISVAREVRTIGEVFDSRRAKIEGDRNLSDEGKQNGLVAARQEASSAVQTILDRENAQIDYAEKSARTEIEKSLLPVEPPDTGDHLGTRALGRQIEKTLRHDSIMRAFVKEDAIQPEIDSIYLNPSTAPEIRAALETAPPRVVRLNGQIALRPWVSEEMIGQQRIASAKGRASAAVERLEVLQGLRVDVNAITQGMLTNLKKAAPRGPNEPVPLKDGDGRVMKPLQPAGR